MSKDVFKTEAWFSNLLENGFEKIPCRFWILPLGSSVVGQPKLHLMQHAPGAPLSSLGNYYSGLYGPIGTQEQLQALSSTQWRKAAECLRCFARGAVVRIQPMEAESMWVAEFEQGLRAAQYWTDRFFCFGNWYQTVPEGGFDTYWLQRPSALQGSFARGQRRLSKAGTWRIDIYLRETDGLNDAITAYEHVYAKSWKQSEPCPRFMPGLIRTAAREGWLRLGILWLNGKPLAAQVWLIYGAKANIYKLAYVDGQERFSPGSVLTATLMKHVMDVDHVREVDYLNGDDAYKRDWMDQRRERTGLLAFDQRHWRGWLSAGLHFLGRWKRNYLKQLK